MLNGWSAPSPLQDIAILVKKQHAGLDFWGWGEGTTRALRVRHRVSDKLRSEAGGRGGEHVFDNPSEPDMTL